MNLDLSWGRGWQRLKKKKKKIVAVVSFPTVEKYMVFTSVAFNSAYEF